MSDEAVNRRMNALMILHVGHEPNFNLQPSFTGWIFHNLTSSFLYFHFYSESTLVIALCGKCKYASIFSTGADQSSERKGRGKSEKTDKGALHNPIVRFHGPCLIIFLQRLNFLLPRDLKTNSSIWSGRVRSILCWFYGWEDGNHCQGEKEEHEGQRGKENRKKRYAQRQREWWVADL